MKKIKFLLSIIALNGLSSCDLSTYYNSQGYINISKKSANFASYNNSIRIATTSI